jgi:hypothetical protein
LRVGGRGQHESEGQSGEQAKRHDGEVLFCAPTATIIRGGTGFDAHPEDVYLAQTQWTIDNAIANGYIDQAKKPTVEQVVNMQIANEAIAAAGGRVIIGGCTQ